MAEVIRVEGADQLAATLGRAAGELGDLRVANAEVARYVSARASADAPKVSGRLASSVYGEGTETQARVSTSSPYGGPIHFGWHARNISPNPFIIRAFDESSVTTDRMYADQITDITDRVKGI